MNFRKSTIIAIVILTITLLSTPFSNAQGILGGILQAAAERYIDNSGYSSQDKENMKNALNSLSNELNVNQNAVNATRDAYNGNYTGAVIQGAQTIMNATGNYQYDTYLNSANQINNANREYQQDIQNGMDRDAALNKRNTTIGNSAAESVIELQDRVARERAEQARQKREAEWQSREENNYYSEQSSYETNTSFSSSIINKTENSYDVPETSWEILRDYALDNNGIIDHFGNGGENNSYNSNAQILSASNSVKFLTEEGENVFLHIMFYGYEEGSYLAYNNHSDKAKRLSCNRATVKVKFVGNNNERTFTDACSFVMPAHSEGNLEWSSVFPNHSLELSDAFLIESIKVLFVDTQITNVSESNGYRNNNSDVHLLTKNKIVKFFTDEGTYVALGIDKDSGKLLYNNLYNDREIRLNCNKVSIKIKYVGDDTEYTFTDACSFIMPANTYDYLEWSDVFFSISEVQEIESIKVLFEETQIK